MKQNDEAEITIDIGELVRILLRKLPIILGAMLLCGAGGFGYASWYLPKEYTSSTSMYVKNNNTEQEAINQQDLAASKSLTDTYIVILQNNTVVREVGDALLKQYGEKRISQCFPVVNHDISVDALNISMTSAPILGIVLNGVGVSHFGYGTYRHYASYGYGNTPTKESENKTKYAMKETHS